MPEAVRASGRDRVWPVCAPGSCALSFRANQMDLKTRQAPGEVLYLAGLLPPGLLFTLLLVLSLIPSALFARAAAAEDHPVVSRDSGRALDDYLSRLERFGFSGGALAVRGKEVLLTKSYGFADRARRIPLTTGSVYNLGSITKQFTAAAILTLEMQGKLAVSDLAGKYLDGVPADKSEITLHHLLTHSSGL